MKRNQTFSLFCLYLYEFILENTYLNITYFTSRKPILFDFYSYLNVLSMFRKIIYVIMLARGYNS